MFQEMQKSILIGCQGVLALRLARKYWQHQDELFQSVNFDLYADWV